MLRLKSRRKVIIIIMVIWVISRTWGVRSNSNSSSKLFTFSFDEFFFDHGHIDYIAIVDQRGQTRLVATIRSFVTIVHFLFVLYGRLVHVHPAISCGRWQRVAIVSMFTLFVAVRVKVVARARFQTLVLHVSIVLLDNANSFRLLVQISVRTFASKTKHRRLAAIRFDHQLLFADLVDALVGHHGQLGWQLLLADVIEHSWLICLAHGVRAWLSTWWLVSVALISSRIVRSSRRVITIRTVRTVIHIGILHTCWFQTHGRLRATSSDQRGRCTTRTATTARRVHRQIDAIERQRASVRGRRWRLGETWPWKVAVGVERVLHNHIGQSVAIQVAENLAFRVWPISFKQTKSNNK